jgi:predicted kinase
MNHLERLARKYRLQAEALRTIASTDCSEERSKTLSQIARDYDLMAYAAVAIERSYHQLSKRKIAPASRSEAKADLAHESAAIATFDGSPKVNPPDLTWTH